MPETHPTEAACLLEQGATYHTRIGLKPVAAPGDPIFAGFKHGAFSVYFGDAPIYHFDLDGRWQRAFVDGTHYLKGLDATIHAIHRVRDGPNLVLKRKTLTYAEANDLDARVCSMALELIAALDTARLGRAEPTSPKAQPLAHDDLRAFLERIGSWDSVAWFDHCQRYRAAYARLTFLPPECQNAVVLQATLGETVGFGPGGLPATAASARSAAEFERHSQEVAALWGRRLLQTRVVFLGGSDVLHLPVDRIAAHLSAIGRTFPIEPKPRTEKPDRSPEENKPRFDGVHVFLDDFVAPRPDAAGWRELAARGMVRISLGVESGDAEVRRLYSKDWDDDQLRATVVECKAAGVGASVLMLVGAGGAELAGPHVENTARLIESLELGAGDFVFLLDENEMRDQTVALTGLSSLRGASWTEQRAKLKESLAPLKRRGIKVLPYTMEKQGT